MSSPRHISHSLLLPTTGLQFNTSSKPSEAYQYHRSPVPHLAIYLILHYCLLQVYKSTRRQNPQNQSITTGHHVTTSPYILISSTTYYRSTGQHVVKTPRIIPIPQVTMSPPRHISYSLLLPTTGLQVNTSSNPSESYHYHRSPCPHLAIYLILYYYLPQVYRSTRRQTPQKHTSTTGHHVPTSPYISFSTTTHHRSTGQHVVKTLRSIPLLQVTMSPPRHMLLSSTTYYRSTGQHVVKTLRINPLLQVTMSPPRHISSSSTTYYRSTGQHVVKALRIILYYRSTCPHLAIYLILYYYLLQGYRSTRRQNPQNQSITTGHHVTTSPYILFSTTTFYRSTGQHVVKPLRSIPLLQVTMSLPHHVSYSLLLPTTGLQVNTLSKPPESYQYHRSPCQHLAIYLILYYYLLQVYRSTRRQTPQKHTITTGHHVTTSPCILFSPTTYYRSTGQHVVKTPRIIPIPQVTMSAPRHISFSLLLPTTGLQVNTSSNPSEAHQYYRSPCPHLAIYLILYHYLPQVYRSTRRQNPQKHTITTGHHVPTSPYVIIYYHLLQVYRSTRRQNPQMHTITTGHHVSTSPYISFSTTTYHRSTGQHVVKTLRTIPLLQVTMSPPHHISYSPSIISLII